jgi:hypothetical protein
LHTKINNNTLYDVDISRILNITEDRVIIKSYSLTTSEKAGDMIFNINGETKQ